MYFRKSVLASGAVLGGGILAEVTARVLTITAMLTAAMMVTTQMARSASIEFVTAELPWAAVDKPYAPGPIEVRTNGRCPLAGMGFAVTAGALPHGIVFSRLGYFSGSAARTGSYGFTIRAANGCSWTSKNFVLVVREPPAISVKPERLRFQAVVGEGSPPEQILRVSASWPRLSYEIAISGGGWVKALPDQGRAGVATETHLHADGAGGNENGGAPGTTSGNEKSSPSDGSGGDEKKGAAAKKKTRAPKTSGSTSTSRPASPPATVPGDTNLEAAQPLPERVSPADEKPPPELGDAVHIRIDASGLQRGYYSATITFTAWQAQPATVFIELAVLSK